ncbi:two pore calcium channel protein 1-like [Rhopilema esculentum]|uniref:two pore calcium channel protein 1-like n=1 Tax=Rhopilema esculentum TaxID=499914 RepID=UPI0031E1F9BC
MVKKYKSTVESNANTLPDVNERSQIDGESVELSSKKDVKEEKLQGADNLQSDGSRSVIIVKPNNQSKKSKWYHKIRLSRKGKQGNDHEFEKGDEQNQEFEQRRSEKDDETMSDGLMLLEETVTKSYEGSHATTGQEENNHKEIELEKVQNKNFKTMEALGMYGLLTPAIAAVPTTDEFDSVHKQIKAQLGDDWELKLAADHIDDALKGRGKHGKARSHFRPKFAQRCFRILDNVWYQRFFLLAILVHALLIFVEPPSSGAASMHFMVFATLVVCLMIYTIDLVMRIQFHSWKIFWANETEEGYWNGVQFLLVCLFWIDFIILCTSVIVNSYYPQPFRCLRLVMLLCRVRSIRHIFEVLAIIGTSLLKVLFIILIFIITFACIGVHLYMDTYNESFTKTSNISQSEYCCVNSEEEATYKGAFDNVGIAILRLFVLLSTENYPEIMLPALRKNKLNFFYFGVFVFFGGFFLTAILLAIVVDSYWVFAKKTIKKERARERTELAKAWNILDPFGLGALSVDDSKFMDLFRLLKPKNSDEQNIMLIHLLDSQGDGEIDSFEWTTTLREALNAEFEEDEDFSKEVLKSKFCVKVRDKAEVLVESGAFSKFIVCLILLHGALFCLKWKGQPDKCETAIHGIRTGLTVIFLFEIIVRVAALGKRILRPLEIIDISSVFVALTFNCIYYGDMNNTDFKETCVTISSLAIIIRWLLNSSGTRKAFRWFLTIVPVMFDLVVLLFVILHLLATIAMEIFHSHGLPKQNQIYPDSCALGFKDFWCSFLIMFQTLTTSNWHEIMNLAHSETKSVVAYFFFPLSYLIITMIVMNLFVAIAIEAANKLTSRRSESMANSLHQSTIDSTNQKPKATFQQSAKKILAALAKDVIGSARVEETQDRSSHQQINSPTSSSIMTLKGTRKGSTTIILSPSSSKRGKSNNSGQSYDKKGDENQNEANEEDEEDETEDYSGLSPKERRERQLKNRMKKKRKARQKIRKTSAHVLDQIQKQVRAIASFRGSQPTDLDFIVGDTITVIATRDEWMQGECKGATGWFPASHVVNWSAKILHESRNEANKNKPLSNDAVIANDEAIASTVVNNDTQIRPKTPVGGPESESLTGTKKPASSLAPQTNYMFGMFAILFNFNLNLSYSDRFFRGHYCLK